MYVTIAGVSLQCSQKVVLDFNFENKVISTAGLVQSNVELELNVAEIYI